MGPLLIWRLRQSGIGAEQEMHRSHRFLASNQFMPGELKLPGAEEQTHLPELWLHAESRAGRSVLLIREPAKTYSPGAAVDGVTSELRRNVPEDYPRVTFVDVTAEAGIDFRHFSSQRSTQLPEDMGSGAAWGDYDNDGDLDLYLCDIAHSITQTDAAVAAAPALDLADLPWEPHPYAVAGLRQTAERHRRGNA